MELKRVWVIEQGSYSDYRVVGVFSSEANAKLLAVAINSAEHVYARAEVAEWSLDPAVSELRQGHALHCVLMRRDGTVERVNRKDISGYEISGDVHIWERSKAPAYKGQGIEDALDATVWAKDEDHAVKIANEHRTRMIASGEWK